SRALLSAPPPPPPGGELLTISRRGRSSPPPAQRPLRGAPPVRSALWVAAEGCCDDPPHHRRGLLAVNGNWVVPQRFAIDWMKLDESHRAWVGDPTQLSSYFSYGQPLIAAADGTVVVARDGIPDSPPPLDPP